MSQARGWWMRLGEMFRKQQRDRELEAELQSHLEMHIDDNLRAGMTPGEARRQALIALGGVESAKESYRERRGVPFLEHLAQDLRYGFRVLRRNPGFSFVAVLALALGIGANTALFSVVYGVLLRPLPYTDGNRLVEVHQSAPGLGVNDMGVSAMEIADYRAQSRTLEQVEEFHDMNFILLGNQPDRVRTGVVSAGFFPMLGVKPLLGRTFLPSDDRPEAEPVLVLSFGYWKRSFGGDPGIIGKKFKMNDRMHAVVGVLPNIPQFPREADVYMPTSACPFRSGEHARGHRDVRMMNAYGRLRPDATVAAADAEMRALGARFEKEYPAAYPSNSGYAASVQRVRDQLTSRARPMLLLLLGTTALVLLICCTNVANLALARIVRREHEFAVRSALGASRARLVRQLLTESTLLAVAGGVLGLLFASLTLDLLVAFVARFTTRAVEVSLSTPVLLFTFGVSVATGLLFGSLPALAAGRGISSLKVGGGTTTVRVHGHGMRSGLMIAEVALSFILLAGAGLMVRTLVKLQRVDAGFNASRVVTMRLPWNWSKYREPQKRRGFDDEILRRVSALPGVMSAGMISGVPLGSGQPANQKIQVEGRPPQPDRSAPLVDVTYASPQAFQTLEIPLLRGRVFSEGDRPDRPPVAVISALAARHSFGNDDPIGHRISGDGEHWATVVGVVGDVRNFGLDREPMDTVYLPLSQQGSGTNLMVRTLSEPMSMAALVRKAVQEIDSEQPVVDIKTLDQIRGESLLNTRVTTVLLAMFAGLALVIAATGLAGVTAFLVSQRTREIGIRLALGAQVRQVVGMVLSHGVKLILAGAAAGLLLSMWTSRMLQKLLFETTPADWPTLLVVAGTLVGTALGASYIPARRATRVDPMIALRCD